jgi:hypothetical protein
MRHLQETSYIKQMPNEISFGNIVNHLFLSGGAIASLLQNESPNDWDMYFKIDIGFENFKSYMLNNHADMIKDVDERYRAVIGINGKMITSHAITMNDGISFIIMQYGSPKTVKETFDYVHATPHYDLAESKLYISAEQYGACVNKKLVVNNLSQVNIARNKKFLDRGYVKC